MRLLLCALLCGCGAGSDFSQVEGREVFDDSNAQIHALHLEVLELPEWPASYQRDCPNGGRVEMESVLGDGGAPSSLSHRFVGCGIGGWIADGEIDYLDIETGLCGGDGVAFEISGSLAISGEIAGACSIAAREDCGSYTGRACGYEL